jgi:hypothetical protein
LRPAVHGPAQPQAPRDPRLKDGWRAAAKAFRKVYGDRELYYDQKIKVAIRALKEVVPELNDRDAMLETIAAIHYASAVAPKWLYALYQPEPRERG